MVDILLEDMLNETRYLKSVSSQFHYGRINNEKLNNIDFIR
jgi:hypothetical protein